MNEAVIQPRAMRVIGARVPSAIHRYVKSIAMERDQNISDVVLDMICEYKKRQEEATLKT